ncbi:MAG: ABC transporter ATP-binding protein [Psychromonas sp.]|nr:ABC transporter ATP-binding protein [Psychromonas sp.]
MSSTLQSKHVCFSYNKRPLFEDINLNFKPGECIALIGANGAGKSTLLQLLLGLVKAQSGEILLNDTSIANISRKKIAQQVAFVPQSINLPYAFRVQALVAMGRTPYLGAFEFETAHDKAIINLALRKTDISHLHDRLVNTLSSGERQRVLIARAIAQQTPTILFDEPIASLDICHQIETLQLIQSLSQAGKLTITAFHDLNLASYYCPRLILIGTKENGIKTIIADGSPEQVLTAQNLAQHFSITADICKTKEGVSLNKIRPIKNR